MTETRERDGCLEKGETGKITNKHTRGAIIACTFSLIATVALFVGLRAEIGFAVYFIFAAYAVSLTATGKKLLTILRYAEVGQE